MKAPTAVNVGDLVDGKYRLESKIGSGGMAVVYSARHTLLDERVALKFLDPKLHASTEAKARFSREAKASFSLRSEHVARVLDVGETQTGTPFIVMELLEGFTMAKYIEDNGIPAVSRALSFAAQASEGVAEAHSRGIVHRDIKPENLFVTPKDSGEPLVRVLDFGISKALLGEREGSLTGTNDLIGTPSYMAPEQFAHARTADARADVWSLGIILYWLLTGTTPFDAPTPMGIMSAILTRKPTGASAKNPRVPRAVDDIILKCITQERDGRYTNAKELLRAIEPQLARVQLAESREQVGPPSSVTEPRRAMQSAPPTMQAQPLAMQSQPPTMQAPPRPIQAPPRPMQPVRTMQSPVRAMSSPPRTMQSAAPLTELEPMSLDDAPTYADAGGPMTGLPRAQQMQVGDDVVSVSTDAVSISDDVVSTDREGLSAGPPSGRTAVMTIPQRASAPPPETQRVSSLPSEPMRVSSLSSEPQRVSNFPSDQQRVSNFPSEPQYPAPPTSPMGGMRHQSPMMKTFPLARASPLQQAADAIRASAPPPAPMMQPASQASHSSNWQNAPTAPARLIQGAPPTRDKEQRNMIIAVLLAVIVIAVGVVAGLGFRAYGGRAPEPAPDHVIKR